MGSAPKQDHTEIPVLVGRRSTRLSVAVPISISGTDATGNPFTEHTFTLSVNKHGAEIATSHLLAPGSVINVENSAANRRGQAKIIRRGEKRSANSPYEVSVELLEPENVWGLRFPPSDWNKETPKGLRPAAEAAAKEIEKTTSESPAETAKDAAEVSQPQIEDAVQPLRAAEEHAGQPEAADSLFETPQEEIETGAAQRDPASQPSSFPAERRSQPHPRSDSERFDADRPATDEPKESKTVPARAEEKGRAGRTFEQSVRSLSERLDATFARLEMLLSRADQASSVLQSDFERARAEIQRAGRAALDNLRENLRSEVEKESAEFARRTAEQMSSQSESALKSFEEEARARLARLAEEAAPELKARHEQSLDTATSVFSEQLKNFAEGCSSTLRADLQKSLEESGREFSARLSQSMTEKLRAEIEKKGGPLETARLEMQAESAEVSAQVREQCSFEAAQASKSISRELEEATESIRASGEEANKLLWESSKTLKHDLSFKADKLRKELAEMTSKSETGFRNYMEVQTKGLREEIETTARTLASKVSREFSEEIQKSADSLLEASSQQLHRQAEDALEMSRGGLESASKQLTHETAAKLEKVARDCSDSIAVQAHTAEQKFRANLEKSFSDFLAKSSTNLDGSLTKLGELKKQSLSREIESESAKAAARVTSEIQARSEAAAKEAADAVYRQVGVATVVLKDWGDQATAKLESYFKIALEEFQKKVAELSTMAREADRQHAETVTRETQARLEQASRILSGEPPATKNE